MAEPVIHWRGALQPALEQARERGTGACMMPVSVRGRFVGGVLIGLAVYDEGEGEVVGVGAAMWYTMAGRQQVIDVEGWPAAKLASSLYIRETCQQIVAEIARRLPAPGGAA